MIGLILPWAFLGIVVIGLSLLALHIAKYLRKRYHNDDEGNDNEEN